MKAAIYCRLSEEDRNKLSKADDSNSIKNQKAMLTQYALSQGWAVYDIYSDDDYAGADRNRPQFQRLLADAEARRFDIVLCKTQSRFTRELELVEKYIHGLFPVWGIRFVSIVDHADTDNRGNKKSRQINGLVNEWYLEDLSDNIRSVLTSRREQGFHIGAFAPYGYKKDPEKKGHLVIDPDAAGIVREIFSLFADGYGKTAIAKRLNDRGVPNPTEYKRQLGLRYTQPNRTAATLWKYPTIAHILVNEVYIGNLVQGKYGSISYKTKQCAPRPKNQWIRVEAAHQPIIDLPLWNRVQQKVRARAKPLSATGMIYPFSGIVQCMHCGYAARPYRKSGHYYLQCATRTVSPSACPGAFIPGKELEQIVLTALRSMNRTLLDQDALLRKVRLEDAAAAQKNRLESALYRCREKTAELSAALQQLDLDRRKGILTDRDCADFAQAVQEEKSRLDAQSRACREKLLQIREAPESEENAHTRIAKYTMPDCLTRTMAELLIDHITIGRRNKETGHVPVTIFWKF